MTTKTRRQPTEAQKQAAVERRERMRKVGKTVSAMTQEQRNALVERCGGIVTVEGRPLSLYNTCFVLMQNDGASVVGGFQQWRHAGRMVRKGERAIGIWIPSGNEAEPADEEEEDDGGRQRFILGNVFDVTQTDELSSEESEG